MKNTDFTLIKGDILDHEVIERACRDVDLVCYVATDPDASFGDTDIINVFRLGILTTYNLLEAMRENNVKKVIFTSTFTIYGKAHMKSMP